MARARNIKPGIMENEDLAEMDFAHRLLFIYLWMLADREGRIEDRPKRIKVQAFPYDDAMDIDSMLNELASRGFIVRYSAREIDAIQVVSFKKHQAPHVREKDSSLPSMEQGTAKVVLSTVNGNDVSSPRSPDSLILRSSDSQIVDSLIPDSLIPDQKALQLAEAPAPEKKRRVVKPKDPEAEAAKEANSKTWQAYADSYFNRYGAEPVRNAKANKMIADIVKRLGADEAPQVAFHYVTINDAFYLRTLHDLGNLLSKCESIRTQWATGRQMTGTTARQIENTQSNISAAEEAKRMMREGGIQNAFLAR